MIRRLVEIRFDEIRVNDGIKIMKITIGRPINVGVANEANRFSFI